MNEETGEILVESDEELTEGKIAELRKAGIREFRILFIDGYNVGPYLRDTLVAEKVKTTEEAIVKSIAGFVR